MIAIINIIVMVVSGALFLLLYVKSVRPATLELKIGAIAYKKCTFYRSLSSIPMGIIFINYILYFFFPMKNLTKDSNNITTITKKVIHTAGFVRLSLQPN